MQEESSSYFGIIIAYIVPGAIALLGLSLRVPALEPWIWGTAEGVPTIGGFLYLALASITLGMTSSVVRWAVLDSLHHATGVEPLGWSDGLLHERLPAYVWIVRNHYRYYQFYGNTLVAMVFAYGVWRGLLIDAQTGVDWVDASVFALASMFFAGSRNSLQRYYARAASLLGSDTEIAGMTNGGHHDEPPKQGDKTKPKDSDKKAPQGKSAADKQKK